MNKVKKCPVCHKKYIDEYIDENTGDSIFVHQYGSSYKGKAGITDSCLKLKATTYV